MPSVSPQIVLSGLLPHPPIVVPLVGHGREELAAETVASMRRFSRRLVEIDPEVVVLISPHAPRKEGALGLWRDERLSGDLSRFAAPNAQVSFPNATDFLVHLDRELCSRKIATWWIMDQRLDHGAVVPLWFLQEAGWNGRTVVMGLNYPGEGDLVATGEAIRSTAEALGIRTAVVASGDMSHRLMEGAPGGFHRRAQEFDRTFVDLIDEGRLEEIRTIAPDLVELAGQDVMESSIIALAAVDFESRTPELFSYQGPFGVGYSIAIFRDVKRGCDLLEMEEAGAQLIETARDAVELFVRTGERLQTERSMERRMPKTHGVFLTIRRGNGELRGCMGSIGPVDQLVAETIDRAIASATQDPRFTPMSPPELDDASYELSLLREPVAVESEAELDPAKYGVIMRGSVDKRRAILLPGIDSIDTVERQLSAVRRKASIAPDEPVMIYKFTVDKFTLNPTEPSAG